MHLDNYDLLNNIKISIIHFGIIERCMFFIDEKIPGLFFHWK